MSKTQRLEEREASCYEIGTCVCVYLCMQDGDGMEVCTCVWDGGGSKCRREGGKGIEVRKLGRLTTCPGACIGIRQPKAAIISSNKAI